MSNKLKKNIYRWFRRGGIFHPTKNHFNHLKEFGRLKDKKIINIGSGGHNPIPGAINIDPYTDGPNTICAFGENLPFENNTIDLAVCAAVLEHVKSPELIVAEMYRVLKLGGKIYIVMPFLQPYHGAPGDYSRLTLSGTENLCRQFTKISSGAVSGGGSTLAWIFVEYVQTFFSHKKLKKIAKNLAKVFVWPLKYIDDWLIKKPDCDKVASAFYFYGEK
ncbi:MAG TPA: class I SAM-dependent methyltransferase [Patescibacteria group bacterium]|nr:class I SAM-dependent methyltransferase [Patescibacteria group bacterium]